MRIARSLLLMAGVLVGLLEAAPAHAAKDNWVYFPDGCVTSFNVSQAVVTDGEDYEGVTVANCAVNVIAGRKKSAAVATAFSSACDPDVRGTFRDEPDELNFFIKGDMTVTDKEGQRYAISNICLAQGSNASIENWWFAGLPCRNSWQDYDTVACKSHDNDTLDDYLLFQRGGVDNGNNEVKVLGDHYDTPAALDIIGPEGTSLCVYNATPNTFDAMKVLIYPDQFEPLEALSSRCYPIGDKSRGSAIEVSLRETVDASPVWGYFDSYPDQSNDKALERYIEFDQVRSDLRMNYQSGNWTNSYSIYNADQPEVIPTWNWLGQLPDSTLLNAITMPGSHDAGMSVTGNCTISQPDWAKTQEVNIRRQADSGSRYFDIRVEENSGELYTYHKSAGLGCSGQTLRDVMDNARNFLRDNPTEFLILKFSHTTASPSVVVNFLIDNYSDILFKHSAEINLADTSIGELRGTVIAVFDEIDPNGNNFSGLIDDSQGIFPYEDCKDSGVSEPTRCPRPGARGLWVYDVYSNNSNAYEMAADQQNKLANFGGLGQNYLFLLSWTVTGALGEADVEQITNTAHGLLPGRLERFQRIGLQRPNIVYLDFVNTIITQGVINENFGAEYVTGTARGLATDVRDRRSSGQLTLTASFDYRSYDRRKLDLTNARLQLPKLLSEDGKGGDLLPEVTALLKEEPTLVPTVSGQNRAMFVLGGWDRKAPSLRAIVKVEDEKIRINLRVDDASIRMPQLCETDAETPLSTRLKLLDAATLDVELKLSEPWTCVRNERGKVQRLKLTTQGRKNAHLSERRYQYPVGLRGNGEHPGERRDCHPEQEETCVVRSGGPF